ncbi:MAG: Hint domain-containing protein [Rhodobacteraceae bacterium]|nr:Hint domain-containing protein [Paracoccaceae bacterium]
MEEELLVGLWDFAPGSETLDTGVDDGVAQNGELVGGATISGGALRTDGVSGRFSTNTGSDAPFDMDAGTIEIEFTQVAQTSAIFETVLSRGIYENTPESSYFEIHINNEGRVVADHFGGGGLTNSVELGTDRGFASVGDTIRATYEFTPTGGTFTVNNLTTGEDQVLTHTLTGLTLDVGPDDDPSFTFGARHVLEDEYNKFFNGEINYVSVTNGTGDVEVSDGIVSGTAAGEIIDTSYTGDPDGDRVDNADAILPGEAPNDDIIRAGAGNDTIIGGLGENDIEAGDGADSIVGGNPGDDVDGGTGGIDDDTLDLRGEGSLRVAGETTDPDGDSTSGVIEFLDGTGAVTGTMTFAEIENLLLPDPTRDGIVSGTDSGDLINTSYTGDPDGDRVDAADAILPGEAPNDDIIRAGAGNDTIIGGLGENDIEAGDGADSIIGGNPGDDVDGGTGGVDDDTLDLRGEGPLRVAGETTDPDGDSTSGTIEFLDGTGAVTGTMGFAEIENLLLPPPTTPVPDGIIDGTDAGDLIDGTYTGDPDGDLVDAGDAVLPGEAPNDDIIRAGAGNDTIVGGLGENDIEAGDGADSIVGGNPGDDVDGGTGGVDEDVLDLRGAGPLRVVAETTDPDGDSTSGIIEFLDPTGAVTGTMAFAEIETLLLPDDDGGDGIVEGTPDGELIDTSYDGDPEGDVIDGGDAIDPTAGPDDDVVVGDGGDDTIISGAGDDSVEGGPGSDDILTGDGDDTAVGGGGNDNIDTGDGADSVVGGDGGDVIDTDDDGTPLTDLAFPGYTTSSGVVIPAAPGDTDPFNDLDTVQGGSGNDTIFTGDDADVINGEDGADVIDGGIDADTITGGGNTDLIFGGEGADSLLGGDGDDTIYGGLDPIFPDVLNIRDDGSDGAPDPVPNNGTDFISGGAGNDLLFGQDDDDTMSGDDGDDTLDGGIDDDVLRGGSGNDSIIGGQGSDLMIGNADRDTFFGVTGGDTIDGSEDGDDFDTLNLFGAAEATNPGGSLSVVFDPANAENGTVNFFAADGTLTDTAIFENIENVIVPCFTPGTRIATPTGERLVETLAVGDRIITRDNGIQQICWVGRREMTGDELRAGRNLMPVRIRAGALGDGLPERDMMVSPNHRILMANDKTALYFEDREVLVAAKHLTGLDGVDQIDVDAISYIHIMFDQHEVVLSDGSWTESFQPGDQTLAGVDKAQREEILAIFPELQTETGVRGYNAARRSLKRHEAQLLVN